MAPVWTTSDEKILFPMHSWPWRHTMTGAPRNMWSGMRSLSNLNLINWLRWSSLSKNDVTQSTDTVSRSPWNAENKKSTQGHEKWVWGSKWSNGPCFSKMTSPSVFTPTSVPALWLWSHPEFASAPLEPAELKPWCGKIYQKPMGFLPSNKGGSCWFSFQTILRMSLEVFLLRNPLPIVLWLPFPCFNGLESCSTSNQHRIFLDSRLSGLLIKTLVSWFSWQNSWC